MSYTLLKGEYVIRYPDLPRQGPEPDGDTVKFRPDTPALVERLPRPSGTPPKINGRGISARLEAIDALETHFGDTHQEPQGATAARDELLALLGFTGVVFFPDLPNQVRSADQDTIRGHMLANGIDGNGRLIAFAFPGDHPGADGSAVFLDEAGVNRSANAALLGAGLAYPAFYATLPADLRVHLAAIARAARAKGAGFWPRATGDPDGSARIADLRGLQEAVLWPKLFRRLVPYLAPGRSTLDGFDAWLREDPVNRDDQLFLLEKGEYGNMHDVVRAAGNEIRLTAWPEDFIISPDPAPPGAPVHPRPAAIGDVLIVAARPDRRLVTLINATPSSIDLRDWALLDAAGGCHALSGTLDGGAALQVTLDESFQNSALLLTDGAGVTVDQVSYKPDTVLPGRSICFGR
ncbi:hypothetical protein ACIBEJ_45825 [Nonomuraea sp. NPDC050790]|uniref:hypothetical protein n=1 Tax=Nonomuraea sp. NPDC050790 TaxID=3364371 RepID=UPI0037B6DB9D